MASLVNPIAPIETLADFLGQLGEVAEIQIGRNIRNALDDRSHAANDNKCDVSFAQGGQQQRGLEYGQDLFSPGAASQPTPGPSGGVVSVPSGLTPKRKPPAVPGDSQSLTVPGVGRKTPSGEPLNVQPRGS